MASASKVCGICDARNISALAVKYCHDCEDSLCEGCHEHHSISKATKHHSTISIENYNKLPQFIRDIKQHCTEHEEIYQNYCINHDIPLCKICVVKSHKHCKDTTTLEAMTQNAKSSVALDIIESRIKDVHLNVKNILIDRKENLHLIKETENNIQKEISVYRATIFGAFDRLESQLLSKSESIKNNIGNIIEDIETKNKQLNTAQESVNKIKRYASEIQAFLGMKEIENQVRLYEEIFDSMIADGILNHIELKFERSTKIKRQIAECVQICKKESPSTVNIVRREVRHAQQSKKNKSECIKKRGTYRAEYSYDAKEANMLSFNEGDILILLDDSDSSWWLVRKIDFQTESYDEGMVPADYLMEENLLYCYAWFVGPVSREELEKIVIGNGNVSGSFVVSESKDGTYLLSVLHQDNSTGKGVVHNYRINHNVSGYYLRTNEHMFFSDLPELIKHYSSTSDGLVEILTEPCYRNSIEIEIGSLELKTLLHSGKFRNIWQGTLNKSEHVAIGKFKTVPRACLAFRSEAYVLRQCRHERIISLYGVCSFTNPVFIITELASKGNLATFLKSRKGKKLKFTDLVEIAAQIADGMQYLEKKKIVHKNLAAKRILLVDDKHVKISNFQLTIQDECFKAADGTIDEKWIAPEAALLGRYSIKSDVWSFGIVLVELLLYGKEPYPGLKKCEVLEKIQSTGYRHPKPKNCTEPMYDIMKACWQTEPEARVTFDYLFSVLKDYFVAFDPFYTPVFYDVFR